VQIEMEHGKQTFHFDRAGAIAAVTTVANAISARCATDTYHYGEPTCVRVRAAEVLPCDP
jgi:hypothetical protein